MHTEQSQLELPIDEHAAEWHEAIARDARRTEQRAKETGCKTMERIYRQLAEDHEQMARNARSRMS
jgi:hypothetical protein